MPRYKVLHAKKAAFLAAYREGASIRASAEKAAISRMQVYRWLEHDAAFLVAFHQAEKDAVDSLEDEARRRAVEGVRKETPIFHNGELIYTMVETRYSDTLMIFLLKGMAPEKYRERVDVAVTSTVKTIDREAWEAV